jgi:hypothetical protein
MWIELDAGGAVTALHLQTCKRKLEHIACEKLGWPAASQLAAALWAALVYPRARAWLPSAVRSVVRKLV